MNKIIPIKDLRNTNEISKLCKEVDGPIYITKNGYSDLVIMSNEYYNKIEQTPSLSSSPIMSSFNLEEQDSCLGYVKVASINFSVKINHITHNSEQIILKAKEAYEKGARVLVFPELALTGYSCGDMFLSNSLLKNTPAGYKDAISVFASPLEKRFLYDFRLFLIITICCVIMYILCNLTITRSSIGSSIDFLHHMYDDNEEDELIASTEDVASLKDGSEDFSDIDYSEIKVIDIDKEIDDIL